MLFYEFLRRFRQEIREAIVLFQKWHRPDRKRRKNWYKMVLYWLALQLTAGLLVVSEELHGVHVRHVNLVGQQAVSPGRSHRLHILVRYQGLRRQTDLHFLTNSNMDSFPRHFWELMRVLKRNFIFWIFFLPNVHIFSLIIYGRTIFYLPLVTNIPTWMWIFQPWKKLSIEPATFRRPSNSSPAKY